MRRRRGPHARAATAPAVCLALGAARPPAEGPAGGAPAYRRAAKTNGERPLEQRRSGRAVPPGPSCRGAATAPRPPGCRGLSSRGCRRSAPTPEREVGHVCEQGFCLLQGSACRPSHPVLTLCASKSRKMIRQQSRPKLRGSLAILLPGRSPCPRRAQICGVGGAGMPQTGMATANELVVAAPA